jgi:drug/metabolite transporter (DMT)-like permease
MTSPRAVLLRALTYLAGGLIVVGWAFQYGVERWDDANCGGPDEGDCDLGVLAGFGWGAGALVLWGLAVVVLELWLRRRRQRLASASADATR